MKQPGAFFRFFLACLLVSGPVFGTTAPSRALAAQPRYALVIGNADYKASPLKNPVNDAEDMALALEKLDFSVTCLLNATLLEMERAVRRFGKQLTKEGVGLFYYAGHGLQVDGRNYLVSVDAAIQEEYDIKYESLDAGFVLDVMDHSQSECNIMILDACRDNPFARSFRGTRSGLAKIDAPIGTIIAYATAPGQVAMDDDGSENGLYTGQLLKNMEVPGLTIEEVFKRVRNAVAEETGNRQVPWESTSLRGTFCFNGCANERPLAAAPSTAASPDKIDKQMELAFWNAIEDGRDPEMLAAYLKKYPKGTFSLLAKIKLEKLKSRGAGKTSAQQPPAVEPKATPEPEAAPEAKPAPKPQARTQPESKPKPAPKPVARLSVSDSPKKALAHADGKIKKVVIFPWYLNRSAPPYLANVLNYLAERLAKDGGFELLASYYPLDHRFKKAQMDPAAAQNLEQAAWKKPSGFFSVPKLDVKAVREAAAKLGADLVITGEFKVEERDVRVTADVLKIHLIRVSDGRMRTLSTRKRLSIYSGSFNNALPALASDMLRDRG